MTTYHIQFVGRTRGALGIVYECEAKRIADTPEAAVLALYDEYEHISSTVITPKDPTP